MELCKNRLARDHWPLPRGIKRSANAMNTLAAIEQADESTSVQQKLSGHGGAFLSHTRDGGLPDREYRCPMNR